MSDILEPWLAATIEAELGEALRHWEDCTNRRQSTGKSRERSYDDGSNLRILCAKKGPVVQITKFLTFKDPIQVTLSDSVIRVNTSIANQASQRYADVNRKNITEGTVGGLIQLQEFEIVATHIGPRDKRLTLYVKDFKPLGSNGSGNFGIAPQAIESREGTKNLLKKLAGLRKNESDGHSEQSAAASPIRSQSSTQASEAGNDQDSQLGFATQVPRSIAPNSKPKSSLNIGSAPTANSAKSLAPPGKAKHGNPLLSIMSPPQAQAAPQAPVLSEKKSLISLLRNQKLARLLPDVVPEQPPGRVSALSEPIPRENGNEASRIIALGPSDDNAVRAPIRAQKRKRQSPNIAPRKKVADNHDSHGINKDRESLAANHDLENRARSGVALTEASDTLRSQPTSPSLSVSMKIPSHTPPQISICSVPKISSSTSAHDTGRSRISRRDLNIPKDQEILLSRADSWLPAEPGQREPTANIPISLLKTLNQKTDLRAQRSTKTSRQIDVTMSPNGVIDPTSDSETDNPLSSGQWPASPDRDQLPPDSSLETTHDSDHSVQRMSKISRSVSSVRKQSHASVSSQSTPSRRPSPILAGRSEREPESPPLASLSHSSPGDTSTSAGEMNYRFTCQAPDCKKSYKRSSSLKRHMDRHHPNAGSLETFKCLARDCTKSYPSPKSLKYHIESEHDRHTVPPSHSGSVTPATPSASTSMFPDLKSWSERDDGSRQKVAHNGAGNESDSVEISAPRPVLLDRGSKSPRDVGVVGRPATTFVLENDLPPRGPHALVQPATEPDENHVAREPKSSLLPASPTPESDLEMAIPLALNEKTDSVASSAPIQRFPSTASQPQDPFTQVKRTPYVNGRVQSGLPPGSGSLSSPLKSIYYPLAAGNSNDDTEYVSASVASGPQISTAETRLDHESSHIIEDQSIGKVADKLAQEIINQEPTDSITGRPRELTVKLQIDTTKEKLAAHKTDDSYMVQNQSHGRSSSVYQPVLVAEANTKNRALPEMFSTIERTQNDRPPQLHTSNPAAQFAHETKRKVADSSLISPSVTKRQKRFKIPSVFTLTGKSEAPRDPSEGARQYRQDFLASRRSSESSTPTMSPTMPFSYFPGTTPEHPRDPSERARQIRQEFLASRRGSETSTPTTSPRILSAALTETSQAMYRNPEVQENVEQVTVQNQSSDTDVQHQKMTELEKLSARSQTEKLRSDAAQLPNGTPDLEIDHVDGSPGSQDIPPFNYKRNTPLFVTQDAQEADVKGPDVERNTVIEATSYVLTNEKQRAPSVELHVSVGSPDRPDHPEAEDGVANANGEADQAVDPENDMWAANHGRSMNRNEEDRLMGSESDKVNEALLTWADEVAEQGSNEPRSRLILKHVAGTDTAALESIHHQCSVKENLDTQTPDQIPSELTFQQRSVAMDGNTLVPAGIAIQPTSHQEPIGKDTDTPMPDAETIQDITLLTPISHAGESMNQTTSLPSVVPAFVLVSNTENQPHLSPTASSNPAILPSSPVSGFEEKSTEEQRTSMQLPVEITRQRPLSLPLTLFDKFKTAYPAYPGDMKHFAAICRKISQLVKANRMEHQSLWDDFIVRHKVEYSKYLERCAEEAEDAVPYEIFYQDEIEGPQYQKRVINRRNLEEALALVVEQPSGERMHREPIETGENRVELADHDNNFESGLVVEKMDQEDALVDEKMPAGPVVTKPVPTPAVSDQIAQKPSEPRILIDLTEDDPLDDLPKSTKEREVAPQPNFGPLFNGVSVGLPSLQYRRDRSGSLYQVPYDPPAMRASRVRPLPQPIRSPLVRATASTNSAIKSLRRSLPWEGSDHNYNQSSPKISPSDSSRLPNSALGENRAKGSSNVDNIYSQVSASSTPKDRKQSQNLLNTCHRVIQSSWGIKAHELLEPEYNPEQGWSETMIELLAEIASKVKVNEARHRIKGAIDTRIRENARRDYGYSSRERKISKSDLEAVKDVVESSSMTTTSPFSPPLTNAAVEKQNEGTPPEWWKDASSPFKSFARAYAAIRPGNGNSFAQAGPAKPGDTQKVQGATSSGIQLRKIDIMRWNL